MADSFHRSELAVGPKEHFLAIWLKLLWKYKQLSTLRDSH
jgi:hypothetical protein